MSRYKDADLLPHSRNLAMRALLAKADAPPKRRGLLALVLAWIGVGV